MSSKKSWSYKLSLAAVFVCMGAISTVMITGQPASKTASHRRIGAPDDWTHHHLVFSNLGTYEQAYAKGAYPKWIRTQYDTRFLLQQMKRNAAAAGRFSPAVPTRVTAMGADVRRIGPVARPVPAPTLSNKKAFQKDWGQSLGAGGTTGAPFVSPNWWPVYPAKYTFDTNANPDCTNDYAVFPTNLAGVTGGQAGIIAYNKLYAGTGSPFCSVTNPAVYWSYNTNFDTAGAATTGTVQTSPVISLDGTKVAFVENRATGGAILHLLKWHALDGGAINTPVKPTIATVWTADGAAGHCPVTGACLISIVLNLTPTDTASSPFYDYGRDAIYVGDDSGRLHKIINAFGVSVATPSEMTTGNWPISVGATRTLTSPTLDPVSGNIFVADGSGFLSYFRETFSTAGTCNAVLTPPLPCLGSTTIQPGTHVIADAPIVDSSTEKVFVFIGNTGTSSAAPPAVIQSDVTLTGNVTVNLGTGTAHHLHAGDFDNNYFTGNGSVGRFYMCGSSSNSAPTIYRIGFTNSGRSPASPFANPIGTMNATVDAATLPVATNSAECSPVTEFYNANASAGSQDQIFFGVQTLGSGGNCASSGCVMSVNVTETAGVPPSSLSIAHSIAEVNGPSGIIVDNNANTGTFAQASSLYFSTQGNGTCNGTAGVGCAVKVTQANLF
jgi:hypothetical protein